jgi:hypothetical protein
MNDIVKCAALGVAVGAGIVVGTYVGGKVVGATFTLSGRVKKGFLSATAPKVAVPAAAVAAAK